MRHLTTTTELLSALRRGHDQPAWSLFVERYRPVLVAVAQRMGLNADDAQDAAQQTLFEFVRDFGNGRYDRERSRLRSWLLGILRHRVADLHRLGGRPRTRKGAHSADGAEPLASGIDPVDAGSEDEIERVWQAELDRRIMEAAFARLRDEGQVQERSLQAFELTVLREVPAQAAAEACGMTINAVYIARSRVAEKLRRMVERLTPLFDEGLGSA